MSSIQNKIRLKQLFYRIFYRWSVIFLNKIWFLFFVFRFAPIIKVVDTEEVLVRRAKCNSTLLLTNHVMIEKAMQSSAVIYTYENYILLINKNKSRKRNCVTLASESPLKSIYLSQTKIYIDAAVSCRSTKLWSKIK